MKLIAAAACVALVLSGCVSTSSVVSTGPNTYTVTATADGMRTAVAARESALQQASKQCAAAGRQMLLLNETSERTRMNIDTTYTLNFRCIESIAEKPNR